MKLVVGCCTLSFEWDLQGLDQLHERCKLYYKGGARFAKWRAPYYLEWPYFPSAAALAAQSMQLALYAKTCQLNGLVPIVEPEIVIEDKESIEVINLGKLAQTSFLCFSLSILLFLPSLLFFFPVSFFCVFFCFRGERQGRT